MTTDERVVLIDIFRVAILEKMHEDFVEDLISGEWVHIDENRVEIPESFFPDISDLLGFSFPNMRYAFYTLRTTEAGIRFLDPIEDQDFMKFQYPECFL